MRPGLVDVDHPPHGFPPCRLVAEPPLEQRESIQRAGEHGGMRRRTLLSDSDRVSHCVAGLLECAEFLLGFR